MKAACRKHGVPFDEHYGDVERARQLLSEGINIVHTTPDALLFMERMTSVLRPVRELANKKAAA